MDLVERQAVDTRRHPWEVARADFYLGLLGHLRLLETTARCLDAGAGDAYFSGRLRGLLPETSELVCWDPNYSAEDLAAGSGTGGLVLTAERPGGRFDGILLLDVIEHVEDDRSFVAGLVEGSLADGGWVLVGVPAYQALFSAHDRALHHYRRYSAGRLRHVLVDAGLRPVARGGLFHSLMPVRAAMVALERAGRRPVSGEGVGTWRGSPRRTDVLTAVLRAEGRASRALALAGVGPLPGLSTWALCRPASEGAR